MGSVFRDVLPPSALAMLLDEVISLEDSDYEPPDDPRAFTSGSYWCPVNQPDFKPRNLVERYIDGLARLEAFRHAVDVTRMAGAEWWIQAQDPDEAPKGFHTDCNIYMSDSGAITRNPDVASVFYLRGTGGACTTLFMTGCSSLGGCLGPTAIFAQRSASSELVPAEPPAAAVVFPSPSQLMLFSGDLHHGVLWAAATQYHTDTRYTLLVNWWCQRPRAVIHDLPSCFVTDAELPQPPQIGNPDCGVLVGPQVEYADGFASTRELWEAQKIPDQVAEAWDSNDCPAAVIVRWVDTCQQAGQGRWVHKIRPLMLWT